jgi:putative ABC transport system ATP-binding protein
VDGPVIRCVAVRKSYKGSGETVEALRGVDLVINEPGYYAIMGQSGSGKSTLLHLLAALDPPDSGELHVGGQAIHALSEREATTYRRTQIGIVFQQFNLIPTLTAIENVELPGVLAGRPGAQLRTRAAELLEMLGLSSRSDHRPDALSGGEQQRVAIARALLFKPPVVFADEPTGNLDSANAERLWKLLGDIAAEQRTTIVMVTHEPAAAAHCRGVFIVSDGRILGHIDTEGLDAAGVASRYQQLVRAS